MEQKIIIIGGGIAGLSAAQAARETDPGADIRLVCGEKRLPYYRTRICGLLSGDDPQKLPVRNEQWFADQRIEVVFASATFVHPDKKRVLFSDGSYLPYDKLVLATGARSVMPDFEGSDRPNVVPLRGLADIEKIQAIPGPAVVIGNGVLGMEAAWHLSRQGRGVVMVGRGRQLLSRQLDKEGSNFLLNLTERAGVRVALRGQLAVVDEGLALLADGRGFDAGVVVIAAGARSDMRLAKKLGLECGRGIVVDAHMRTGADNIWAAGDCVEFNGRAGGQWTVAMAQGAVAGCGAAGGEKLYVPERQAFSLNVMDTYVWSSGELTAEDRAVWKDSEAGIFQTLFFEEEALAGAELIGDVSQSLALKKALAQGMGRTQALAAFGKDKNNDEGEEG